MPTQRPDIRQTFMRIAFELSQQSTCTARVTVGAVLVNKNNRIVAAGYNGAPIGMPHCDDVGCELINGSCVTSIHAEENAIIQCAREGVSSVGLTMYTTHSPCSRCARRIIQAGIIEVMYAIEYKDIEETRRLLHAAGISIRRVLP